MIQVASSNPLMAGLPFDLLPQPSTFVILGAAGDLARRKLLPALYNLALDGLLPASFAVLGVAPAAAGPTGPSGGIGSRLKWNCVASR